MPGIGWMAALVAAALSARSGSDQARVPAPQIQNGRVETRRASTIDRELASASAPGSDEPGWIAWGVRLIDGDRDLCVWYSDRLGVVRGVMVDDPPAAVPADPAAPRRPQLAAPSGPVPIEAGTGLVVLARVVGGRVERLRWFGNDCPIDAGGRTIVWLDGVAPAESLRFLNGLIEAVPKADRPADVTRRVAEAAVRAIGHHRDAHATDLLDRLLTTSAEPGLRRQAAAALASLRGEDGITRLLGHARNPANGPLRREALQALTQSKDPRVLALLEELLRR